VHVHARDLGHHEIGHDHVVALTRDDAGDGIVPAVRDGDVVMPRQRALDGPAERDLVVDQQDPRASR
jgi:hypothetical protein